MNDIAIIHLCGKRGGFAIVDADMSAPLNNHRWLLTSHNYVRISSKPFIYMHRIVNKTPDGFSHKTDHKNGFRIDNTRRNLRTSTNSQNGMNSNVRSGPKTSRFKGVAFNKRRGKWMAYIDVNQKREYLGADFTSELLAAEAYNCAAAQRFGEFARLNQFGAAPALHFAGCAGAVALKNL